MSLRRRTPLQARRATVTPEERKARQEVRERDQGRCIGPLAGLPGDCAGSVEIDHVRASHAMGKKSPTTVDNLVLLCSGAPGVEGHHPYKTRNGREARPLLLDYIASFSRQHAPGGEL